MSSGNAKFLKICIGVYIAALGVAGIVSAVMISSSKEETGSMMVMAAVLIGVFALLGLGLFVILRKEVMAPADDMKIYLDSILSENYWEAEKHNLPGLDGLRKSMTDLVEDYKERVGFNHSIIQGIPTPCSIVDMDEKITFINQQCLDMLGSEETAEFYNGKMISQLFYKDDRGSLIGKCMKNDDPVRNLEAVFRHRDGSDVNALCNLFPLHDVMGNVIGGCSLYIDTTELKKREAKIISQNESIAKAAEQADDVVRELNDAAGLLQGLVNEARSGAVAQTERAGQTATAMEEMNATVLEVARHAQEAVSDAESAKGHAEEGARVVTGVVGAIDEVATQAVALKTSMEDLDSKAESIGGVLGVIEDIADQTNLLALNAAIEAARAGEAGRGFAVVADEVRKLAEKTVQATAEVNQAVIDIQDGAKSNVRATDAAVESVAKSTELAGSSGEVLDKIVNVAESSADRIRAIAAAAEQQAAASEEISESTQEVSRISDETERAMVQSAEAISKLAELAADLSRIIEEMQ